MTELAAAWLIWEAAQAYGFIFHSDIGYAVLTAMKSCI